ncbi:MAG: hypothetical protein ACI4NU_09895 [Christensenellales bacterium]
MSNKKLKRNGTDHKKEVHITTDKAKSNLDQYLVWCFDMVDNDGCFRFSHEVMDAPEVLEKIIVYGKRKWNEIEKDTHDKKNKSKHHFLTDFEKYSNEAKERVRKLNLEGDLDRIYSLALNNTKRIIGLRIGKEFHPIWYDKDHKFYPSSK